MKLVSLRVVEHELGLSIPLALSSFSWWPTVRVTMLWITELANISSVKSWTPIWPSACVSAVRTRPHALR
jgi:hypothetical protein